MKLGIVVPRYGDDAVGGAEKAMRMIGERLVAFVVVRAPVEAATLEAFARGLLAGPKVPRRWVFVDALPRNPTGKVQKALLRAPAAS